MHLGLETVNEALSNMCSDQNAKLIKEACQGLSCENGEVNAGRLLKKKLRGIINEPPTASLDQHGSLVTGSKALEDLT